MVPVRGGPEGRRAGTLIYRLRMKSVALRIFNVRDDHAGLPVTKSAAGKVVSCDGCITTPLSTVEDGRPVFSFSLASLDEVFRMEKGHLRRFEF
jgi:hypothetical protein